MKNIKSKFVLFSILPLLFASGIVFTSCNIDDSINVDPNAIAEAKVKSVDGIRALLVALQVNAGDTYSRDRSRIASIWSWQMCAPPGIGRAQPLAWNSYNMTDDGPTDDYWVITYRGVKLANDIIEYTPDVFKDALASQGNVYLGIAKTYKAMLLGEAAATWGSIPITINGIEPPDFVDQQTAYNYVQTLLDEALGHFSQETAAVNRDLNFGGNKDQWIAVIHSLKARYYLHIGNYPEALTQANQGIVDNTGNLMAFFSDNTGEYASWGMWVQNESETIRGEKYFVDLLKSEPNDARLSAYFTPGAESGGVYYGYAVHSENLYPNPVDTFELNVSYTVRMKKYSTFAESFPLIRWEENVLIKAEAEARTNAVGPAVADVNIIRANAGLTDFASSDRDAVIQEVLKQKFLELYLEGQSWHDQRRTGTLPNPINASQGNTTMRFIFGQSEKNANPKVPADNDMLVKWLLNTKYGGLVP